MMQQIRMRADRLQRGQRVTGVPGHRLRRRQGQWPTVVGSSYDEGLHVVELELSDQPGAVLLLPPDELVTVEVEGWRRAGGR